MSAFMERLSTCFYLDENVISRRNAVVTVISSFLFTVGWWLVIDSSSTDNMLTFSHYVCGIIGTISFIMVNAVSNDVLNGGAAYEGGCLGENGAKIWLFLGFVLGFSAVIASVWVMIVDLKDHVTTGGIQFLLQNIFILAASLLYKFGKRDNSAFNERI
ncbi:transmembrane protein 50A isoform X1 [Culicoides brevitarsis]|uniref:transmembrane protein 50A isoform X1 n=1 Tax=Culicoides brevitarsis TaxID=469753 RepID=UPI00307C0813